MNNEYKDAPCINCLIYPLCRNRIEWYIEQFKRGDDRSSITYGFLQTLDKSCNLIDRYITVKCGNLQQGESFLDKINDIFMEIFANEKQTPV